MKRVFPSLIAVVVLAPPLVTRAQVTRDVLTYHNDIYRSGVYAAETALRPNDVSVARFGKVFARRVLGQIWGQALYVRDVPVQGKLHNVVYVATSENMVYCFDADDTAPGEQTPPLISVHLGAPVPIDTQGDFHTILPSNGISSTPVIDLGNPADPRTGTLYVVADLNKDRQFHIFALQLSNLAIRPNVRGDLTGVVVAASGGNGGSTHFDASNHLNRPALLISNNHLIIAFGNGPSNASENPIYHGWVISYLLPGLTQTGVFVTTPNVGMGSIWQAGSGLAADDAGNVYFMTGNGHFQLNGSGPPDLADSFVKLDDNLRLKNWYAPPSRDVLEACDLDLGSSGPGIIRDSGKLFGAGKSGILYVLDKDKLGPSEAALSSSARADWKGAPDCTVGQCFRIAQNEFHLVADHAQQSCDMSGFRYGGSGFNDSNWQTVVDSYPHVHGAPVIWKLAEKNFNLYVWPEEDFLKAYHTDGERFLTNPVGSSTPENAAMMSMPGGLLSLSWNGAETDTGIVWASRPNPNPRYIVGNPFVSVFHNQQHFVVRDKYGAIWDAYYVNRDAWHFQEINTNGHPAASDVFVSVFDSADQQHFAYLDAAANVWDSFYLSSNDSWRFQQINTQGHKPTGGIFVSAFFDQQHFVFRDSGGNLWDAFYAQSSNQWKLQQIATHGHPVVGNVFVAVFSIAQQQHFTYADSAGRVWDSFYVKANNTWHFQQVVTQGHIPVGGIFVSEFLDQQHFSFRDAAGRIWDAFYANSTNHWKFQEIATHGNPAAQNVFVSVFTAAAQQHFAYSDSLGRIWDSFYRSDNNSWNYQQIDTHGHTAFGAIFASAFLGQQHFVFRDTVGAAWDSFYERGVNEWKFQQIDGCMYGTDHTDLAPNNAPCNAIDKIVPGYLQAFTAVPDRRGQLTELWNSGSNANDRVEWFAKESPPTIADGKVFLAEFPPKPANGDWNTNNAFGRLLMFSVRIPLKPAAGVIHATRAR